LLKRLERNPRQEDSLANINELKATFVQKRATIPGRDANAYAAF